MDENAKDKIKAVDIQHLSCGWTPFEGWQVKSRVTRIILRGQEPCKDGKILAARRVLSRM